MMRYNFKQSISLTLVLLFSFSFLFAQKFEGTISVESTLPHSFNSFFTVKKHMLMADSENQRGAFTMINNTKSGEKITITEKDGEQIAIVKNSNDMQYRNLNKRYKKNRARIKNVMVKVTRETKRLNGYKCYKVVASDNKFEGEAWITKKMEIDPFEYFPLLKAQNRSMPRVAKALQNSMDGFVLEMTLKNVKTKAVSKMNVNIEKKKVEDKVFELDMKDVKIYTEENVRELMKEAQGNPDKMKEARTLLAQIRMQ